jgi:predicted nucleotidyltransferase
MRCEVMMDDLMEKCKVALAAFPEIELAYWFGSRAKGKEPL